MAIAIFVLKLPWESPYLEQVPFACLCACLCALCEPLQVFHCLVGHIQRHTRA